MGGAVEFGEVAQKDLETKGISVVQESTIVQNAVREIICVPEENR